MTIKAAAPFLSRRSASRPLAPLCLGLLALLGAPRPAAAASPAAFDLRPELTGQAIFSCQAMGLSGNVVVDSRGSVGGTVHGEEGHLRSNAGITLSGNVHVWGDALAGPGASVTRSGNATVHGQTGSAPSALPCVPIALAPLEAQLLAGNDNARIPRTDKNKLALGGGDGRTFTLSGNDGVTLPAGNYFFSSLSLSGNSTIRLEGRVNILVKGAVSISGGGVVRQLGNVFQLRLWTRGNVAISSQARLQGFFYAPEGSIGISGGAHVEGTLFARSLTLSGTSTVRRSIDDGPPSLSLAAPLEGQSVAGCTVRVEGQAADGEENGLAVKVNGQPVALDASGHFAIDLALGGADPSLVVVTATDSGGEIAQISRRVGLAPPALTLSSPLPGTLVGQRILALAGGSGHAAALTVDGIAATLNAGAWQIPSFDLGEDGAKTLSLVAQYCGGSVAESFALLLDTAAPLVAIDGPHDGDIFAASPIEVTGTIAEAHLASLRVGGIAATLEGGRFTVTVPLAEGLQPLQAIAVDALGRTTASSPISVELDATAPEVSIDSPSTGAVRGETQISVAGHSADANLEWVKVNGAAATLAGGQFSLQLPLQEGENSLVAVARDRAGNTTTSPAVVVVRDTLAPTVSLETGELPPLTREAEVTVIGSAQDPHLAAVEVNGFPAALAGESFSAVVPLAEGANTLVATATDVLAATLANHSASSAPFVVVRDSTPPMVSVDAPAAGELLGSRSVLVRGSATDAQPLQVTIGGDPATLTAGAFEALRELGEGAQTIAVRASDSLGQATEVNVAVVVDTLAPELTVDSPLEGALIGGSALTVSGSAADPHLESVTINGSPADLEADGSFSLTVELEGSAVTVAAADLLGHISEKTIVVVRESRPPTLSFDPLPGAACSPGGLLAAIGGTFDDDSGAPPSIVLEVRPPAGASFGHPVTVDAAAKRFSASGVDLGLIDGLVTLVARATDATGAIGQAIASVRVDTSAPRLQLTEGGVPFPQAGAGETPPAGASPLLLGRQVAFGATVFDGGASAPPAATFTLDGQPYPAGAPIAAAGHHLLVARAIDCAGRVASAHAFFRLDRTAPQLLSTIPAAGAVLDEGPNVFSGVGDPDLAAATLDGRTAVVSAGGAFRLAPFSWREGVNTVEIELVDAAGLRATYQRSFTVRGTALALDIVEAGLPIGPGQLFTRPIAPRLVASTSEASVQATLNGAPYVSGTPIGQSGEYELVATATAGGRTASASAAFRLDLSPGPAIAITTPEDASEVDGPTLLVSGTVSGDNPTVTIGGRPAVVQNGVFTLAAYPLPELELTTITAVAEDRWGRRAAAQVTVLPRSAGPRLVILDPSEGTVTGRDRIDVAGAVVDPPGELQSPSVTISGGAAGPVTAPVAADGSFRARDVRLAAGSNLLTVQAVDQLGRAGSATVTVVLDGQPPAIVLTANGQLLAENAVFGGAVELSVAFVDDSGLVAGKTLRLNGEPQTLPAGDLVTLPLQDDGGYLLSATARDGAGNEARAERSFVIDRGGCRLSEIFPVAGAAVDAAALTLTGRSGDAIAIELRVPTGAGVLELDAQLADGTFLIAGVPLRVGENLLELICTDAAGRTASAPAHPLRRLEAGQGPSIEILSPAATAVLGSERTAVSGTLSGGDASVNGVAATVAGSGPRTFALSQLTLAEGPNVIAARAVDAGRTATDRIVVWRDTQAPRIAITSPDSGAFLGVAGSGPARVDVSGRVELSDEPHLAGVRVSAGGDPVTATVDPRTGTFLALAVPLAANDPGEAQTIEAEATDTLGHVGRAQAEVFVDPGGPAIVLSAPADLARYTSASPAQIAVSGEVWAAPGAVVSINGAALPDAAIAWEPPAADGRRHAHFTAQLALPPRDGSFGLMARVVGADQRYAQARRLLIKDSAAPAVAEILPAAGSRDVDPNGMALVLFSEAVDAESLAAPNGLQLVRLPTGESQAVTYTFAGNAVALVPAAGLAAGERYEVRAGTGIRDLAGLSLAAARTSDFTVAAGGAAAAPGLDPLPAVVCGSELMVTGQAAAGAAVKVKDGSLVFSALADGQGRFAVRLPLAANGWHYLSVYILDESSGIAGPSAGHALRVDCSAPTVRAAAFDRTAGVVTVFFSEAMDASSLEVGAAGDAVRLLDAEDPASPHHPGVLLAGSLGSARIQLDTAPAAWWRDRPVRLQVGSPASDERGNPMATVFEQVFFPGSTGLAGGFLFGEAWDDTLGRPLAGAHASLYLGAAGLGTRVAGADADGRGRYTFAGEVAAGRYAVVVEKPGFTPVVRRLSLEPAKGAVPFDARLTPRAAPFAAAIDPAAGGRRGGPAGPALEAEPFALPGDQPLEVQLTALSGQGLPDFLPLGYTPAAAAEMRLLAGGQALAEGPWFVLGNVTVDLPLPSWITGSDPLIAAQYEMATGRWLALQVLERVPAAGGAAARIAPLGPGTIAVLVADRGALAPPPAVAFAALVGIEPPAETPDFEAALSLDPPVVAPTGRSLARLVAHSADGATPWPSGLAVQAFLEEELHLAAGQGKVLEAPFVADLLLYHPRLAESEQGSAAEGSAGALTFVISPSPRAAQVLLDVGYEKVRLYPFPEETERGQVVGPAGGTVGDPAEVELTVPEGALSSSTVAELEPLSAEELAELPAVEGFRIRAALRLGLQGKELARPATLRWLRPAAVADEVAGDPRLVLGEQVGQPEDQRRAFARLAARVIRQGTGPAQRLVAGPEADGGLPLEGIVREGIYLLLEADQPIGFATGFVRGEGGVPLPFARVEAVPLGTADLSRLTGRYAVPVAAGPSRPLRGLHPFTDEEATAVVSVAAGQVTLADLTLVSVPPTILGLQPVDGAADQLTGSTVAVLFSEAIDPASVGSGTLELELVNGQGQGSGVFAAGSVLVAGSQVRFEPSRPLPPGRSFIARFAGGVRDRQGTFYDGPVPVEWRFSTSTVVVPGGRVDPEKFHVFIPENGRARIWAEPGALPLAQAGQPDWWVVPYLVGPFVGRDPLQAQQPARPDGSFEGTVGRPEYAATLASEVWVKVLDPAGQVAAEFEVGPMATADGKGFVAPPGEATTFRSAEGIVVDVPAAAFDKPTLVRLSLLPVSSVGIATPRGLAVGAVVALDFAGEAKETLRLHVPAPAGAATGAQVFVGEEKQMPWGVGLHFLTYGGVLERGGQRFLSNDPSLQAEPDLGAATGGSQVALRAGAGERTCQDVKTQGYGRCFAEDRLPEFVARRLAVFYHEAGTDWSLIAGFAAPIAQGIGIGAEAILNGLESSWVFLPRLAGTVSGVFVLPAISSEPLTLERRDLATGWVLHSQAYSPVPAGDRDLVLYAPLAGDTLRRPMLVAAHPFEILRFAAPPSSGSESLRLDIEAVAGPEGQVEVQAVPGLPVATLTSLALFDASPLDPSAPAGGAPIAGPSHTVCGDETNWKLDAMAPGDRMLLVVGPGDFDSRGFTGFELELDFPIQPVAGKDPNQVARLHDLGPIDGCKSGTAPGYPRQLPVRLELELAGKRLKVVPEGVLAGGHRFELELLPSGLVASGAAPEQASQLSYWPTAPTRFAFATRELAGTPIGTLDPAVFPFGDSSSARDLLRFGNLLLVGSDSGRIVAIDTSEPTGEGKLKLHAISNATTTGIRTFATDGHERLFYTQIFGNTWAIKALRVEDAREAAGTCQNQPEWARDVPCFDGVAGSVRIATLPGNALSAAQFFGAGGLPSGTPSDLDVLVQDEQGQSLDLRAFHETYVGSFATRQPDAAGIYTFDLPLRSTYRRFEDGAAEPSRPGAATPNPRTRQKTCSAEESYDRFQRVTLDNLTTGQTWSIDLENPWPGAGGGNGTGILAGVRARRNDQLRLRYNLKTLGYVSISGSGISVVDLNRFYRLDQPAISAGNTQCGRRLGRYEGADIRFPECAISGSGPEGIRFTPALEVHSETGCAHGQCRGTGSIDVYSPLLRVGGVHSKSSTEDPGYLVAGDLAACISSVGGNFAQPVDAALANDVTFIDYGLRGGYTGDFVETDPGAATEQRRDLLFLALGHGGVFAFDVSQRELGASTLVGHFQVPKRTALRLQFDAARGVLLIGGIDYSVPGASRPVIDVWDVRYANAAPGTRRLPTSTATVFAPWGTRHLALDPSGTGLLYTWDPARGPVALPIDAPRFTFSGLYVDQNATPPAAGQRLAAAEKVTSLFVPLGVPMEVKPAAETSGRFENDKVGTAAFKLRIALPGALGEILTAKVQSLRALPADRLLGEMNVGEAVALPGGAGWPDHEVTVRLRRVGLGAGSAAGNGVGGPLGAAYNLYESVETLLLIADPRASGSYRRQDAAGEADEEGQCRRCSWPAYLPDPATAPAGELTGVRELLAGGRYLRAFLAPDAAAGEPARLATEAAIAFFRGEAANYPLPSGWARVAAPADAVPSPFQVSQAEPVQNAALFSPGEMGVSVALAGGDLLAGATDHAVAGRGMPFRFDRSYRSQRLGYGPLGGGWDAGLFAHLREIETTGEVEYHDGGGQVFRFYPTTGDDPGAGWERDDAGSADGPGPSGEEALYRGSSYFTPAGLYVRLQKLANREGWRLVGRDKSVAEFDQAGRLRLLSDRIRQAKPVGEQGNSLELRYDAFGKLTEAVDDLGRRYRFEYFEDPVADGPRYGLLKSLEDFAGRKVLYGYGEDRLLDEVRLPEVKNPIGDYAQHSYQGGNRPTVAYRYASPVDAPSAASAVAHGPFAQQRLLAVQLPDFGGFSAPRVRFAYDTGTGRVTTIAFPTPGNQNADGASVAWQIAYSSTAAPATEATVTAPWGHATTYLLEHGRTREVKQQLEVRNPDGTATQQASSTAFTYRPDGRLASVRHPDGGEDELLYADSLLAGVKLDRLSLPNVEKATRKAPEGARGTAIYADIATEALYGEDNQVSAIIDGLARHTQVALPLANRPTETVYQAEGVRQGQQIDPYGRAREQVGGTELQKTVVSFGQGAKATEGAGLVSQISVGQMTSTFARDAAGNVERVETSQETRADALYDEWDRPIRSVSGLSSGELAPVGAAACAEGRGARSERAFDAAGHLVRERSLQDFVGNDGQLGCRWVETRYTYNAREQLVEVRQTHLSDPDQPGSVSPAEKLVGKAVFDTYGRLAESHALNQADGAVITHYRYDAAGRSIGVKLGATAEQVQGFDAKSRVVYRSDGDQAVWKGRYDAWDRLWLEQQPTGAYVQHFYDRANNPVQQTVWSSDFTVPLDLENPENNRVLLKDTRTTFTSFGEAQRMVEVLTTGAEPQVRVTERDFDSAGRVILVASGPAGIGDILDRGQARREKQIQYEPETGRVLVEASGGLLDEGPQFEQRYNYEPTQPWPRSIRFFEKIPGQLQLVETQSSSYRRDALGRVVEERRNDGSKVETVYDRLTGQPIEVATGAGATSTVSYDGAGRQVRMTRPNNRGETLYAYDLDGRLRQQRTKTESTDWATTYGYDAVGRPIRVDYQDGSFTTTTWNPDSTVATHQTRDGLTLTYTYDAANRPLTVVPSGPVPSTLEPLDAGNETTWDALSRPTSQRRGDPSLEVAYPSYDLGSRPGAERVGNREALGWAWDIYDRAVETRLPLGVGRSGGSFTGFQRQFDTLDQLTNISALGGPPQAVPLGANWSWGGAGRLWGMTTQGSLGTAVRFGYLGGAGAQPPEGNPGEAQWRLGTLTWGPMPGADPELTATQTPNQVWGQFAFGYRGNEGDPRDGAKIGRLAVSTGRDLFAGAGWSWDYDAGVRLAEATPGRGTLLGTSEAEDPSFRYQYGQGDELQQIVDEAAGKIAGIETGAYGRILSRNGIPFAYDNAGRRTQDDRFHYKWSWRGELVEVTVKETWPEGEQSDFANHQVRYRYDAQSRLTTRSHFSPPESGGERRLLEKRAYVWEGQSLLVEAAYTDEAETQLQWRKTYVPGPSGLDDAVQVKVENFAAPGIPGARLYTYIRDELGTVIGIVGEEENNDPANPSIPVRYLYSPYGEAHLEKSLEIRQVRFKESETSLSGQTQTIAEPNLQSSGALIVTFAAALDSSSLAGGVVVEHYNGTEWATVPAQNLLVGYEDSLELKVLVKQGWERGSSYRVRLAGVSDKQDRVLGSAETLTWTIAALGTSSDFSKNFGVHYETAQAAIDTLGGRFPGGQNSLFQGLWADPVTGISYARARWNDARNAGWLSEDPLLDVDTPNLYAFVGMGPQLKVDPLGRASCPGNLGCFELGRLYGSTLRQQVPQRQPSWIERLAVKWFGDNRIQPSQSEHYNQGSHQDSHRGVFVNGILNYRLKAQTNSEEAEAFTPGVDLIPVWNPTSLKGETGWKDWWHAPPDLAQTMFVNKLDFVDSTTALVMATIRQVLRDTPQGERIPVVLHSQGAAVGSAALTHLTRAERARIDVITIGGAAHGFPEGLNSVTMFINVKDIVPMGAGGGFSDLKEGLNPAESVTERVYVDFGTKLGDFETTHGIADYFEAVRGPTASMTPWMANIRRFASESRPPNQP